MNRQAETDSMMALDLMLSEAIDRERRARAPSMPNGLPNYNDAGQWQPPQQVRDQAAGYDPNRTLVDDIPGIAAALAPLALGPAAGPIAAGVSRLPTLAKLGLPLLYGMTTGARDAEPAGNADLQELRNQLEQQGSPRIQELQAALATARQRQASVDAEAGKAKPGSQARSADAARRAVADEVSRLQTALDAETERTRGTAMDRANAVMMARSEGEAERKRILDAAPKTFNQSYEDLRKDVPVLPGAGWLPAVAGAGLVGATKLLPVLASRRAYGQANELVKMGGAENVAAAGRLADANARNVKILSPTDAGVGAVGGVAAAALPVASDRLTQPSYNPERLAADAYLASLLEIDPKREAAAARAESIPKDNPAVSDSSVGNYAVKGVIGAMEGAGAGKVAGILAESMKPRFSAAMAARDAYSDQSAAELLRMKGAEKYGKQAVAVPKPPVYQPTGGPPPGGQPPNPPPVPPGANPGAGGGPSISDPPAIGGGGPPNLPSTPSPRPQASRSSAYGEPQKAVVRPLVEGELAAGRSVPDLQRVSSELNANGVKIPAEKNVAERLANADALARDLMAQGVSAKTIAEIMGGIMKRNTAGFPAVAGPVLAGAAASRMSSNAPEPDLMELYQLDQAMRGGM